MAAISVRLNPTAVDQIRDQDALGQSRGWAECGVDPVASVTNSNGGDASEGMGPGSLCSSPGGRRFKSCPRYYANSRWW